MTNHARHLVIRRRPRAWAIVLVAGALLIGSASAGEAHDSLLGTSPAAGSTTRVVPAQVTLTLSEPAITVGTTVIVTGPAGPVQTGKTAVVDNTIAQRLQPGSPAGGYTVTWRATSADGHPVSGRFSFTAAEASPGGSAAATAPATAATPTSTPSAAPPTSAAATSASSAPAVATRGTSALWGLLAMGVVVLLLLRTSLARRKPRTATGGERSPRS